MKTTSIEIEIGSHVAIVYWAPRASRQYSFICREYKGSELSGLWCRRRSGFKTNTNAEWAARQHLKDAHGGGRIYLSHITDPRTREWKRIDIA